jgi:hypothetical protein
MNKKQLLSLKQLLVNNYQPRVPFITDARQNLILTKKKPVERVPL